jgi:uncharacterized OB-fold protein
MYDRPLPVIDPDSKPYWDALRQHRLVLKYCRSCSRDHFYPRELCPYCHSDDLVWKDASGRGEIYSYTIARRPAAPSFADDVPYVIAVISLEEGPRMTANIVGADPDLVRIGQSVRIVFDDVTENVTLPRFRVAAAEGR